MNVCQNAAVAISILVTASVYGANPFLDAKDDKSVSANFRGVEWGDDIGQDKEFAARVITTRIAKTSWGAIFKIEFVDLKSRASRPRKIEPEYYIVTDDRIVLLNEENNEAAAKKISAAEKPREFEPGSIYGITDGKFHYEEGPWITTIERKGDQCIYLASRNSGHFKKVVWKQGVGLAEYSMGYGARADGFRLKRTK